MNGRKALKIEWDDGPNGHYDFEAYRDEMEETAAQARQGGCATQGDVDAAIEVGRQGRQGRVLRAAHGARADGAAGRHRAACSDGKCGSLGAGPEPVGGTRTTSPSAGPEARGRHRQRDAAGRRLRAQVQVRLRARGRAAVARDGGAPVKVVWTREDDIHHGFYHTVSVERLEAALDAAARWSAGCIAARRRRIGSTFGPDPKTQSALELGMGLATCRSHVPNMRMENAEATAHTRIGWFRAVEQPARLRRSSRSSPKWRMSSAATRRTILLELIGAPRKHRSGSRDRAPGTTASRTRVPDRHRAPAQGRGDGAANAGWGRQAAEGRGAGHRGASQLRVLRGHRGPREGRR